jgi:hypothetical protein
MRFCCKASSPPCVPPAAFAFPGGDSVSITIFAAYWLAPPRPAPMSRRLGTSRLSWAGCNPHRDRACASALSSSTPVFWRAFWHKCGAPRWQRVFERTGAAAGLPRCLSAQSHRGIELCRYRRQKARRAGAHDRPLHGGNKAPSPLSLLGRWRLGRRHWTGGWCRQALRATGGRPFNPAGRAL